MKVYEYYANILADEHLSIPKKIKEMLKPDSKVRVMVLLEDEDREWNKFTMSQFLKGYSNRDEIYDKL